jgi:O-antigen/teichoic acid export membrane protein
MSRSMLVAKNIATTVVAQIVSWVLQLSVVFFLPHYAGVIGLGKITLAGSFAAIFGIFSSLGTSTVLMRDIPRDVTRTGKLIIASLLARIPLAIVSVWLALFVATDFGYGKQLVLFVGIGMVGVVTGVISDTISSGARGLQNFMIANVGSVIDKLIYSGLTVLVCIERLPLWLIVAAPVISSFFSSLYMLKGISGFVVHWQMPDVKEVKSLLIAGLPFISAGIFVAVYAKSDALFLSRLSTLQSIGWYGLAFRISGTAMALPTTVCSAMLPALSSMYRENREGFAGGVARLINLMIICCIPIAAVMIFCPRPLIQLFSHNTTSFLPAANVVRIYGIAVMLWFVSQATFTGIIACDQQKIIAGSMGIGALISVPMTAACVYAGQHVLHNGAIGAASSDLLVEVFLLVCYLKALPVGSVSFSMLGVLVRGLAAAVPLIVLLYLLPSSFILIASIPCIALYAFLCFTFKCLQPTDMELFGRLIGGKFGFSKA